MVERRAGPGNAERRRRSLHLVVLALAVAGWLVGFWLLPFLGTWTPLALVGPTLAWVALVADPPSRALLRPSLAKVGVGIAAGLLLVAATHLLYRLGAPLDAELPRETARLFARLNVGGFSAEARTGLIALIASSEEIIFRGALLGPAASPGAPVLSRVTGHASLRIVALAVCYGLAMTSLGSGLLVACALGCGLFWGSLRVATRSCLPSILAHVVWNLGVLVLWPIARAIP